jgi:hypothetical protein
MSRQANAVYGVILILWGESLAWSAETAEARFDKAVAASAILLRALCVPRFRGNATEGVPDRQFS